MAFLLFGTIFLGMGLSLGFTEDGKDPADLVLIGNRPNPFSEVTEIQFVMPEEGNVSLQIWTADGQLIWREMDYFDVGKQTWILKELPSKATGAFLLR